MLSISVHPGIRGSFTCPSLQFQNPTGTPGLFTTQYPFNLQTSSSLKFNNTVPHKSTPFKRIHRISASSAFEVVGVEEISSETKPETVPDQENELSLPENEKPEEEEEEDGKPMVKPRLVLKFIWMQKNIALGLDKVIPGKGTVPLSPYYFWPKKDAWEELKTTLESKPWISQKKMIILLNQATDIINLWQQGGGSLNS